MTTQPTPRYDDPVVLAERVGNCPRPLVLGLDVDGVLAPIVGHANDARLLDGMSEAISAVAALADVHVAVISGRSVDDLERFGFLDDTVVIGSHGMESRGHPMEPLDEGERAILIQLDELATAASHAAGAGAWVERKPASVVLQVRQADDALGNAAIEQLRDAVTLVAGASSKAGSAVLEVFARTGDKGSALVELRDRLDAATTVFVGDDVTDEDAFARLGDTDIAVKVGDTDTIAAHRLADPDTVLQWLRALSQTRQEPQGSAVPPDDAG